MVSEKTISAVLVDAEEMIRQGIELLLRTVNVSVVAQAADGREALTIIKDHQPRIAILEIDIPFLNGIELAARIHKGYLSTTCIMLTGHRDHNYVVRSLIAGAKAYVSKSAGFSELALAIKAVLIDQSFISPGVSNGIIRAFLKNRSCIPRNRELLTARQRQVLQLIAEGNSNKEIAALLNLSIKGVEKHRSDLMKRLDLHNTAQVVMFAIKSGIIRVA